MTYPSPRTWSAGDIISVPRLRGDMANLAGLFVTGRPLLVGYCGIQSMTSGTQALMQFTEATANWGISVVGSPTANNPYYSVPFAGWYLAQGNVTVKAPSTTPGLYKYAMGFRAVINGAAPAFFDGGAVPSTGNTATAAEIGPTGADLYQLNPNTADSIAWYGYQDSGSTQTGFGVMLAEWICLPTSGLTSYTGPYGTKVTAPAAAAAFPSGPGTYVTNSGGIAAGATSVTVKDATGMITGGTLGLDYINGQLNLPTAEAATITSVAGTTIGITATSYPHLQNAPVAVPVSAAFLNQQSRDLINFLAYPPILRAISGSTQSIGSTGFPPTVGGNPTNQITTLGATTVDNFSGFSGSGTYTIPVSGMYFVYGQIYYAGTTSACAYGAGISVSGGTIQWGTSARSDTTGGAQSFCMTVRRQLRLTAGQTITLWAYQGSGSNMNTVSSSSDYSRLICVWRSF
jgi:hypothetical protein